MPTPAPSSACGCSHSSANTIPPRRSFLAGCVGLFTAMLLPVRVVAKKIALKLDMVPMLKKVGGWTVLKIKGKEILFARTAEDAITATTSICSHKKSRLKYDANKRQIVCPEHGSRFDLNGKVQNGPAKDNLSKVYPARLDKKKGRIILDLG